MEEIDKISDEEIVSLTLGNQDFFRYLINRYEKKLLNYIFRISNLEKEEGEDVLQEVFIKVYENLNDFDQNLKFSSWVYRITRNQVISNFRKHYLKFNFNNFDNNESILENIKSDLNIERDVDLEYLNQNILKILDKMDKKYKEVLVLKYFEEKGYKEISDILKKPIGTISTLLSRSKIKFKKELNRQNIKF